MKLEDALKSSEAMCSLCKDRKHALPRARIAITRYVTVYRRDQKFEKSFAELDHIADSIDMKELASSEDWEPYEY